MNTINKQTAAFFDLDLTLTRKDSFRAFIAWFYLRNVSGWLYIPFLIICALARKLALLSHKRFTELMLTGLSGMDQADIYALGLTFFDTRLKSLLRPKALEVLRHTRPGETRSLSFPDPRTSMWGR